MDIAVQTYLIYLAICIPVVLLVGWTLHRNGRVFLVEIFEGKEDLADSINHLFMVAFYLAGIGFITTVMRLGTRPDDTAEMIEALSNKIGPVLLVLGGAHITNLVLLSVARKKVLLDPLTARIEARRFTRPDTNV
jgi:H+/gluconate symporter-like permease